MNSERLRVVAGFAVIAILWGSTWLAIKIGLQSVPPFFGVAIRFTVAFAALFILVRLRRERFLFDRTSLMLYANLGVLSFSFPYALVYWGEQYVASGLASVLFAVYPFVVAIGSHFLLAGERLNPNKLGGIVLGFAGLVIIFWSDIHLGTASTLGMGAILLSTGMQAGSLIFVKRKHKDISPTVMTLGGMVVGVCIMYVLAFSFEQTSDIHFDARGLGTILYLGTFGTVVTFVIYYWLLKKVEAVYLSLVSLVSPVLAVTLGALLLDEVFSPRTFAGAGLVFVGLLVANRRDLLAVMRKQRERMLSQKEMER